MIYKKYSYTVVTHWPPPPPQYFWHMRNKNTKNSIEIIRKKCTLKKLFATNFCKLQVHPIEEILHTYFAYIFFCFLNNFENSVISIPIVRRPRLAQVSSQTLATAELTAGGLSTLKTAKKSFRWQKLCCN